MAKNELQIDGTAFRRLLEDIDGAAEKFPEIRREMFEKIAKAMPGILDRHIASVNPGFEGSKHHPHPVATVQSWQDDGRVGSKGGYAAISPRAKTFKQQGTKQYAVGYLTNTLTNGGRTRFPSWRNARYVPRLKYGQIRKRPFYVNAANELQREKNAYVAQFAQELADLIGKAGQ